MGSYRVRHRLGPPFFYDRSGFAACLRHDQQLTIEQDETQAQYRTVSFMQRKPARILQWGHRLPKAALCDKTFRCVLGFHGGVKWVNRLEGVKSGALRPGGQQILGRCIVTHPG